MSAAMQISDRTRPLLSVPNPWAWSGNDMKLDEMNDERDKKKKEKRCRDESERWRPHADKKESGPKRLYIRKNGAVGCDPCGFPSFRAQ